MGGPELSKDDTKKVGFDAVLEVRTPALTALQVAKAGFGGPAELAFLASAAKANGSSAGGSL